MKVLEIEEVWDDGLVVVVARAWWGLWLLLDVVLDLIKHQFPLDNMHLNKFLNVNFGLV